MSKLIYFPIYGRAAGIKILLAHANVDYTDDAVTFQDFGARKAAGEFPNGQVPCWVQDGQYYNESKAILRFLGAQHGYYPEDIFAAWDCDATVDFANDFGVKLYPPHMKNEHSEETKATYAAELTKMIEFFNKKLENSGK